jgi:hypothetical protein
VRPRQREQLSGDLLDGLAVVLGKYQDLSHALGTLPASVRCVLR